MKNKAEVNRQKIYSPKGQSIDYGGILNNEILSKWLKKGAERRPKIQQLIEAPLLISTIDHLIPATEGTRGGKQLAPMLRLLTSDLVLDEPDDFGLEDLPALCRLVNWTAMLGGKALLSTATMPPALSYALFEAYQAGWKDYTEVNGEKGVTDTICCAWFDEFKSNSANINTLQIFKQEHEKYVQKRITNLQKNSSPLCKARILAIKGDAGNKIKQMANAIHSGIGLLHKEHHQTNDKGNILSIGLVRMANINPLVAVAKELLKMPPPDHTHIHYCIYHGKFPLLFRSLIETRLDALLSRENPDKIWLQDEIKDSIAKHPEKQHVFVVLATSVAEVGRDHDYDWAIAEPSSMRSLIQLAGRIQRHRKKPALSENMLILSCNYNVLTGKIPAYTRPGFETTKLALDEHDLTTILKPQQYDVINSIPRITFEPKQMKQNGDKFQNLVDLEHIALFSRLMGAGNEDNHAKLWWEHQATWNAEIQKHQPFRASTPEETFCLRIDHADDEFRWMKKDEAARPAEYVTTREIITIQQPVISNGNSFWFDFDLKKQYSEFALIFNLNLKDVSEQLAEIHLEENNSATNWEYHPSLGVYKPLLDKE